MQCPKCKKEIESNSLKCPFCETKVGILCKHCGKYNLITTENCISCNTALIKRCKTCGAANYPESHICRKCGAALETNDTEHSFSEEIPKYTATTNSQQKIRSKLLEGIKNAESKIITLSGVSGAGKSLVIRYVANDIKNAGVIWLTGECTQTTQLSPFGFFQDLLLTFFNINNFCPDTLQLKKDSLKFFKEDFPLLTNQEVIDLLNFLYPETLDRYENIYHNKTKMFSVLKKVFLTILEKTKVVFLIDNFEYIDGMSFDFLKEIISEPDLLNKCKFVITTIEPKPGLGLISSTTLKPENYLDLSMAPFTYSQVETFIKQYTDIKFSKEFTEKAFKISMGNPALVEQLVLLDIDISKKGLKNITYYDIEKAIELRLNILKQDDIAAYRFLIALSVLGKKFYPAVLENFDNNSLADYERCLEKLVSSGFIIQCTHLTFEFKSSILWKYIVSIIKNSECFEEILNILYETLTFYKQSSIALLAYIVQKLNNNDQAFDIWTLLMKQASYIGDIGLYIITQQQALKLIENKNSEFYQKVKKNIYTRVGKLLEPIDHKASFEYLQQAILLLEDDEELEHIELLGYLASCSMKAGNYWGAIECIENVLNKLPDTKFFNKILVKSRLVTPLLRLGNYGQLINLVETELLPEIEKLLTKGRGTSLVNIDELFELWLNIYLDFAEALVFQGDNRAFAVINEIYEIIDKNKMGNVSLICKTNLLLALANTVNGDVKTSIKILDDILKDYTLDNMDTFIVSRWNLIDILNKFFLKDFNTLYTELFNVAAYANNVNDTFTKNILKTILAKMLKENNQIKKSLEILEEQVAYFAKEKVATGVLLSWYLIAEIKLITSGTQFALDIATKALDIAQSPNINNYYFMALFNKLIGEIYLAKQDFESAKVYLEKAIFISKQFNLYYILVKTYILSAKLYQELALPKNTQRGEYVKKALKMLQEAKNVQIVPTQPALQKCIKEELNILTSFCKLNGIILKKDSNK